LPGKYAESPWKAIVLASTGLHLLLAGQDVIPQDTITQLNAGNALVPTHNTRSSGECNRESEQKQFK
jgi:hypothetical protein